MVVKRDQRRGTQLDLHVQAAVVKPSANREKKEGDKKEKNARRWEESSTLRFARDREEAVIWVGDLFRWILAGHAVHEVFFFKIEQVVSFFGCVIAAGGGCLRLVLSQVFSHFLEESETTDEAGGRGRHIAVHSDRAGENASDVRQSLGDS